jgi:hypothetical protein
MRDHPTYPEERDGKGGKAPSRPQEPIEDERVPHFQPEDGESGGEYRPTFPPDDGGAGGRD